MNSALIIQALRHGGIPPVAGLYRRVRRPRRARKPDQQPPDFRLALWLMLFGAVLGLVGALCNLAVHIWGR